MSKIGIGVISKTESNKDYSEFDSYDDVLKKYKCISIEDDLISGLLGDTCEDSLPVSYCTIENKGSGIDLCGVTLVSPESVTKLMNILKKYENEQWYERIYDQCKNASDNNCYLIFFGI